MEGPRAEGAASGFNGGEGGAGGEYGVDAVDGVRDGLAARLDGIAEAWLTADLVAAGLFGAAGPKLLARLGEVAVLPHLGEAVYWRGGGRFQQTFLGQHGGLTPDEMEIPLVVFVS